MAEGCLLPVLDERQLTREQTLKPDRSAAINDPERILDFIISSAKSGTKPTFGIYSLTSTFCKQRPLVRVFASLEKLPRDWCTF